MGRDTAFVIFSIAIIVNIAMRAYWAPRAKKAAVKESRSFLLDKLNIFLLGLFYIVIPLLCFVTSRFRAFDYEVIPALQALSVLVFIAASAIFWISHRDLGTNWSVTLELKQDHSLITHGIFKRIRHPMYLSLWLFVIGEALCVPNFVGGAAPLVSWAFLYFVRINHEEKMMSDQFGDAYRHYVQATGRLFPKFHKEGKHD